MESYSDILWTDIYSRDIESLLNEHPEVFDSIVGKLNFKMLKDAEYFHLSLRVNLSKSVIRPNEWIIEYEIFDIDKEEIF